VSETLKYGLATALGKSRSAGGIGARPRFASVYDNDELEFDCAFVSLGAPQIKATKQTPIARRLIPIAMFSKSSPPLIGSPLLPVLGSSVVERHVVFVEWQRVQRRSRSRSRNLSHHALHVEEHAEIASC
jgi:hypothetical protein